MREDIASYVADYRGALGWSAFTNGFGVSFNSIEVSLYIKDHPVPQRKLKYTEINTVQQIDPYSHLDTSVHGVFPQAPEPLSVSISGWMITPWSSSTNTWATKDTSGTTLFSGALCYPEIIQFFLDGGMNPNSAGVWQRKDPDYYITPYGMRYNHPIVGSYEFSATTNPKKHQFSMLLYLER